MYQMAMGYKTYREETLYQSSCISVPDAGHGQV